MRDLGALALLFVILLAAGCARPPARPVQSTANMTHSMHELRLAPEQAAECIARNGKDEANDEIAQVRPMYGTEVMAVLVGPGPVIGDPTAVVHIRRSSTGSTIEISTASAVRDRNAFVQRLLRGC